jgi:hypothetical protein
LEAVAPEVILTSAVDEQLDTGPPATDVGAATAFTVAVLLLNTVLVQVADVSLVIVIVVDPIDNADVEKVPDPGAPDVKFMVAVFPMALVAPERL